MSPAIDITLSAFVFAFGTIIGSFLNVCITRWPAELSVVSPASRCPNCARPIKWYENVPVLAWLVLRGRCRGCGEPISIMYPLVELSVGILWLGAVLAFGPTLTALRVAVLATVLLGVMITDAKHYLIPDGFTVFGLLFVLVTAVVGAFVGEAAPFASVPDALIGACAGAGAIAIAGWLGEVVLKKEAMGFGDVTLMAVIGAALGPTRALLTAFVGALLAVLVVVVLVAPVAWLRRGRTTAQPELDLGDGAPAFALPQIPFGVFLAPAAMITLLWGDRLVAWYFGLMSR